jgi:hypothetical protein
MSVNTAAQFIQKIYTDEGLRSKLNAQLGDITHVNLMDNSGAGQAFVKIAASEGYKFDLSDLQAAYETTLEKAGYGELGQGELEHVAGGLAKAAPSKGTICSNTLCSETC